MLLLTTQGRAEELGLEPLVKIVTISKIVNSYGMTTLCGGGGVSEAIIVENI